MSSSSTKRLHGTKGKRKRVSNASSTNVSSNATLSKSASMRSSSFISPNAKSSLGEEQEDDTTETTSKPSHVWLENHAVTPSSTGDQTTVNLVVTERVFPKVKFVDWDIEYWCSAMKKNPFVNLSLDVVT